MTPTGKGTESPLITHIVGARPNFPKAAPVIRALETAPINQRLVHTGQHYDDALSESFFRDLKLPKPDINLGVGSGSHALQTAGLLTAIATEIADNPPALLVVYGDINSTLAAALAASKLGIPLAHVEAGLRSFDRTMPEEVNRVITDQLSALLFTTSPEAVENLAKEGLDPSTIHFVGNPMIDTLLAHLDSFDAGRIQDELGIAGGYAVVTLHRPANVDDPIMAAQLVHTLTAAAELTPLILPLHPRGRQALAAHGLLDASTVRIVDPLGYIDFVSLVRGSRVVITDSGGIQEETTMLGVPCLTLRPNTERPITITQGTNQLVDTTTVLQSLRECVGTGQDEKAKQRGSRPAPPLWDGRAGERIADVIRDWMQER